MTDDLITIRELAKMLRLSRRTIDRWRSQKRLPLVEFNMEGQIRYRASDAAAYIASRAVSGPAS